MLEKLKSSLYFPIASYFAFFASIQLKLWHPMVIVVTGSSGKTTLLHLLESQIRENVRYSHHANSSFGIPFDILDLHRKSLIVTEWISLFILAPVRAFKKPFAQKIYIVETDCDRPHEGKFLSKLLKPNITLWVSSSRTHSMNFDNLVRLKRFSSVDEAIAFEYGYFLQHTKKLAIVAGENELIAKQFNRTNAEIHIIKKDCLNEYTPSSKGTDFVINKRNYHLPVLVPQEIFYSLSMTLSLIKYLNITADLSFSKLTLPPGRSSLFPGIKDTTLIDSSYNANLSSMRTIIEMFVKFPAKSKWAVLGDMLEQGNEEREEHEKLADLIAAAKFNHIILMGPRVKKYTYPKLKELLKNEHVLNVFVDPKEVLDYLNENLRGGETVLFKGARFLEGVIEHLLTDKHNADYLCRREKIWQIRREKWGL